MTEHTTTKQEAGYEINGVFYPFPKFPPRVMDPILVCEVTGLDWHEFVEGLEEGEHDDDPRIGAGLIAMAIWQRHPSWSRGRVLRELSQLSIADVVLVGMEDETSLVPPPPDGNESEGKDEDPPLASVDSPETSKDTPASSSDGTSLNDSGHQESDIGSPA